MRRVCSFAETILPGIKSIVLGNQLLLLRTVEWFNKLKKQRLGLILAVIFSVRYDKAEQLSN